MSQPNIQQALEEQHKWASSPAAAGSTNLVSPGGQGSSKKQRTHQDDAPDFDVVMEQLTFNEGRIAENTKLQKKSISDIAYLIILFFKKLPILSLLDQRSANAQLSCYLSYLNWNAFW